VKPILSCLGFILFTIPAFAQYTSVTGTVTDSNGIPYSNASGKAQLVVAGVPVTGQPTLKINSVSQCQQSGFGSAPCQVPFPGTIGPFSLDANGNFPAGGVQVQDNTQITPSGTQWLFTINETPGTAPPVGTGPQTCNATVTISGATQVVSPSLNLCPALTNITTGVGHGPVNPPTPCIPGQVFSNTSTVPPILYNCGTDNLWHAVGPGALSSPVNSPSPFVFNVDLQTCGPDPWMDVRCFGARAINPSAAPAIPGITGNCTSGSSTLTINTASLFLNGDGITAIGCGATNTMATPSAPTVVASLAADSTGTGYTVADNGSGATQYCYLVVARDIGQGLTAPSTQTCIANGQATLGKILVNLSTETLTNNSVSVATLSATNLQPNAVIQQLNTSSAGGATTNGTFGGWFQLATTPTTSSYTYLNGRDARQGWTPTAGTGGTVSWFNCNHVCVNTPTAGQWQFFIYGRTNPATTLLGQTTIINGGSNDPSYLCWDDFGPSMMGNYTAPYFVPTTVPSIATNDSLTTTIASGAGTTTLTMATNALNTAPANTLVLFDDTPNVVAAHNQAFNINGGQLFFPVPPTYANQYVFNSYTDLGTNPTWMLQCSDFLVNDTINFQGSWRGDICQNAGNGAQQTPQFAYDLHPQVNVGRGNPGVLLQNGCSHLQGLNFTALQTNAYNTMFITQSCPMIWDNIVFSGGGNLGADDMGVEVYAMGTATGNWSFGTDWKRISFLPAYRPADGETLTPVLLMKNMGGEININYVSGGHRGYYFHWGGQGGNANFVMGEEVQGSGTPLFVESGTLGSLGASFVVNDTSIEPNVTNFCPAGSCSVATSGGSPSGGYAITSGNPMISASMGQPAGQNVSTAAGQVTGPFIYDGALNQAVNISQTNLSIGLLNVLFVDPGGAPAVPTCSVVTAGPPFSMSNFGGGTFNFAYAAIYPNGGQGKPSPAVTCTMNGTTQQATINIPTAVTSAGGYQLYWGTGAGGALGNEVVASYPPLPLGLLVPTCTATCQGFSPPSGNGGGIAGIQAGKVWAANLESAGVETTATQCFSAAAPAVCSGTIDGFVTIAAGASTVVVNTTAVTSKSTISLTFDTTQGTNLGVTCNTSAQTPYVSARTAATSFTIAVASNFVTNPGCIGFHLKN